MAYRELAPFAVPARPDGMAPMRRRVAMTFRGPKRSTKGPTTIRTIRVAQSATMFELPDLPKGKPAWSDPRLSPYQSEQLSV